MIALHPAVITAVTLPTVQVRYLDDGSVHTMVSPSISSLTTGYFWGPKVGDRVVVGIWPGSLPFILCGLSVWGTANAALLPSLQPQEQALYGPNGQVLKMVTAGDVDLTVTSSQKVNITIGSVGTITIAEASTNSAQIGINGPNGQCFQINVTDNNLGVFASSGLVYIGKTSTKAVQIGNSVDDSNQVGINGPNGQVLQMNVSNADVALDTATGHIYLGHGAFHAVARQGDPVSVSLTTGLGTITTGSTTVSAAN